MKQLHDDFYYRDAYADLREALYRKPYIKKYNGRWMIEDTEIYLSRRNKRIAIRRALYTLAVLILAVLIAVWGLVWSFY